MAPDVKEGLGLLRVPSSQQEGRVSVRRAAPLPHEDAEFSEKAHEQGDLKMQSRHRPQW